MLSLFWTYLQKAKGKHKTWHFVHSSLRNLGCKFKEGKSFSWLSLHKALWLMFPPESSKHTGRQVLSSPCWERKKLRLWVMPPIPQSQIHVKRSSWDSPDLSDSRILALPKLLTHLSHHRVKIGTGFKDMVLLKAGPPSLEGSDLTRRRCKERAGLAKLWLCHFWLVSLEDRVFRKSEPPDDGRQSDKPHCRVSFIFSVLRWYDHH